MRYTTSAQNYLFYFDFDSKNKEYCQLENAFHVICYELAGPNSLASVLIYISYYYSWHKPTGSIHDFVWARCRCCDRGYTIGTGSGVIKKPINSGKHKYMLSASITQCHSIVVGEWLLINAHSAIFQLYHDENKFIVNEMMMMSAYFRPTRWVWYL